MSLNEYASRLRLEILDDLLSGAAPRQGEWDEARRKEGSLKGRPQLGTTRFEPEAMIFEYIYPDSTGSPLVLSVRVDPPERIVFMPVPGWVIETIWQGEVAGSYRFESEAQAMLETFSARLEPEANRAEFSARPPTGRA